MTPEILAHPTVQAILAAFPGALVHTPREGLMIDPTDLEIEALYGASNFAGEYLDSIGKTDLAALSEDEWMTLMEATVTGYQENLQNLVADRSAQASSTSTDHVPEEEEA